MTVGPRENLLWLKGKLEKEFKVKSEILSGRTEDKQQIKVLNRIISWTPKGLEYEADLRHSELVVQALGLQAAKTVVTPAVPEEREHGDAGGQEEELTKEEVTAYRAITARINFLSIDRPDLQYAVKECSRYMGAPTRESRKKLKRVGTYLKNKPRMVFVHPWKENKGKVQVYTDSDWAGCKRTRKSTSSGVVLLNGDCIHSWSKTQSVVALSSGEAELYAMVKATGEGLGVKSLLQDLGMKVEVEVLADASAALGIVARKGLGKVRHLHTNYLWIQDVAAKGTAKYKKSKGADNPADVLTKPVDAKTLERHCRQLHLQDRCGRAQLAPELQQAGPIGDHDCAASTRPSGTVRGGGAEV